MTIARMRVPTNYLSASSALFLTAVSPALAQRGGGRGGGPSGGSRPVAGPTHIVAGPVRGPVAVTSHYRGPVYAAPRGGYYGYGRYPYYGYRYPGYAYAAPYHYPYYAF